MLQEKEFALTERQKRELEYHREYARQHTALLKKPFSWDVLEHPSDRWWNAYWQMYDHLTKLKLEGKRVLVVGCGFGDDALRLAKLGATVFAFDLCPDSLNIAKALAIREGLSVTFDNMAAESLAYEDNFFDVIIARDILHHVDIPLAIREIKRVAKPGGLLIVNEIYSHSITNRIRQSAFVERFLYPKMQRLIYGADTPYITQDERKLTELDIEEIVKNSNKPNSEKYYNFLVTRIVPDRFVAFSKVDRLLLIMLKPIAHFLAGRIFFSIQIAK
ncbi:class I SAM-dependent methyltransferase [Sedimenticola hydrogenitrophicus]|uniref:class I SAM-dependent methyltransferase n=1 Tax=Sedimenticola hydrogenitrophicus TaxID=2967975 RepID=UPI0023AEA15E|nr:class I SAM-dependent methyltransferase [Sedimenticola hydrogenitrophicus]